MSLFRPVGIPILRKVRVLNLNAQNSIQMLSISGNTIHFHCSFFADKVGRHSLLVFRPVENGCNRTADILLLRLTKKKAVDVI